MNTEERRRGPAGDDPLELQDWLSEAISALPDPPPARNLWPGIEARIAGVSAPRRAWSVTMTLPQLAMAASLLVAVSAGVSWLALGSSRLETTPIVRPIVAVAEPVDRQQPDVQRANFADVQYDAAVVDLERILEEERDTLDPRTVIVIERNLQAIDEAIRQARAALDADPANPYLNSHLADARRRKLDLLRRAASLSSGGD
jgi:hypothetical protein